jgi:glutamyl-tRNA reductase
MRARPERPLVIIDIAVPRDVEPGVERISNVFLYNIDDLIEVSDSNRGQREEEIERAQAIIDAEVDKFCSWWTTLEVRLTVSALARKAEEIRRRQLNMTIRKLRGLSDEEHDTLDAMTKAIVKKILHEPIQCLKKDADKSEGYTRIIHELFRLEGEKPE